MAKIKKPLKKAQLGGPLGNIWTGPFKEGPAYKKAMADKKKGEENLAAYKNKADAQKAIAITKVKKK